MRYALNSVPINGWQTLYGSGQQSMYLSAIGADGRIVFGSGLAAMAATAEGSAHAIRHGQGQAATTLSATGDGKDAPRVDGAASMALSTVGNGVVSPAMLGEALMEIFAADLSINQIAVRGSGEAGMEMAGTYGIPSPRINPTTFTAAHPSTVLRVPFSNASLQVPPIDLERVAPDGRLRAVPPERRA